MRHDSYEALGVALHPAHRLEDVAESQDGEPDEGDGEPPTVDPEPDKQDAAEGIVGRTGSLHRAEALRGGADQWSQHESESGRKREPVQRDRKAHLRGDGPEEPCHRQRHDDRREGEHDRTDGEENP